MSTIGDNIKKRRLELDMTQEELALLMGYKTKSSINKIELGVADIPQSKIVKFAQVLHTSVGALMGWEETKNNDAMADIIIRMRSDESFFSLVKEISSLTQEQIEGVAQFLNAFVK